MPQFRFNIPIAIILIILLLILSIYNYFAYQRNVKMLREQGIQPVIIGQDNVTPQKINVIVRDTPPIIDPLIDYDRRNMYDPLQDPVKRPTRRALGPIINHPLFDEYTRGYPDNYNWVGTLTNSDGTASADNKILRLMGREKYPGASQWEYYTLVNSGHDQIKTPIVREDNKKTEVYTDDIMVVSSLSNAKYKVTLNPDNFLRYTV